MNKMNEKQKWQELANRYLNAETSVEEELELLEYYTKTNDSLTLEEENVRAILFATTNRIAEKELSINKADEFDKLMEKNMMHNVSSNHSLAYLGGWIVSIASMIILVWFIYSGRTNEENSNTQTDVANYKTDSISKMLNISMNIMAWGLLKSSSNKHNNKIQSVIDGNKNDTIPQELIMPKLVSEKQNLKRARNPIIVRKKKQEQDVITAFIDDNNRNKNNNFTIKSNEHKINQTTSQSLTKYEESPDARSDSFNIEQQITDIITASNVQGEQVETYEIQRVGDANIVTRRMADGYAASYIIMTSDNNKEYHLVPLNIEF